MHNVVVTSDICKMYRCILIDPIDRKFQRIIWRNDKNEDIQVYELNTVTYGTASAPYLAIRCLKELANYYLETSPHISRIIDDDFYVDDCMTGFENESQAISQCQALITALKSAGFELKKWRSNNDNVLKTLGDGEDSITVLRFEDKEMKILGIQWSCKLDTLSIFIHSFVSDSCSKRVILSEIAKIYDPLGLVSPCIILFKLLMQTLWCLKIEWDEEVPSTVKKEWIEARKNLEYLNNIKIPRQCVIVNKVYLELHGFCDSSIKAYGACVYLRSIDKNGKVMTRLICSKSKVAPLKTHTITRLELCGALLLSKLMDKVSQALNASIPTFLWTDSEVVLWWIHTEPYKLPIFVANRVNQIQELTNLSRWSHVKTKENPADLITRGVNAKDVLNNDLWWNGPIWLSMFDSTKHQFKFEVPKIIPELKSNKSCALVSNIVKQNDLFLRYNSLLKLKRVVTYCFRFYYNAKQKSTELRNTEKLTVNELEMAMNRLVKLAQNESFVTEIRNVEMGNFKLLKNKFKTLAPFLDKNGLLRVGGRLKHASCTYDTKHPLVLDAKHKLAKLILEYQHKRLLHGGIQLLLHTVRQEYWIIGGLGLAKSVVKSCLTCTKFNPKLSHAIMADLPKARINVLSPFSNVGIDFAGPFKIKDRNGRGCKITKGYICLFICFSTKAIHLEVTSDLSTENFLSCLRRFIGRRDYPSQIWSDNGKNFVGAENELKRLQSFLTNSKEMIIDYCSNNKITWHFIPPLSPHHGGLWESNIKGVKNHLLKIISNVILTYEEFQTVLIQVEAILNSRPLHPISNDPNDLNALTPFHFLIGKPMVMLSAPNVMETPVNGLNRYQLLQQLTQSFWNRWTRDYMCSLQQRNKWMEPSDSLKIGQLVLLKLENVPPAQWPLARIVELHPGKDGVPRVVTVKTNKGLFKRSIVKLCKLPIE